MYWLLSIPKYEIWMEVNVWGLKGVKNYIFHVLEDRHEVNIEEIEEEKKWETLFFMIDFQR